MREPNASLTSVVDRVLTDIAKLVRKQIDRDISLKLRFLHLWWERIACFNLSALSPMKAINNMKIRTANGMPKIDHYVAKSAFFWLLSLRMKCTRLYFDFWPMPCPQCISDATIDWELRGCTIHASPNFLTMNIFNDTKARDLLHMVYYVLAGAHIPCRVPNAIKLEINTVASNKVVYSSDILTVSWADFYSIQTLWQKINVDILARCPYCARVHAASVERQFYFINWKSMLNRDKQCAYRSIHSNMNLSFILWVREYRRIYSFHSLLS